MENNIYVVSYMEHVEEEYFDVNLGVFNSIDKCKEFIKHVIKKVGHDLESWIETYDSFHQILDDTELHFLIEPYELNAFNFDEDVIHLARETEKEKINLVE